MDNQEIKVRSIRADESTYEKFKALSAEFENQGDCLTQLIVAYEISKAKHILVDMQTDIADYESHISSIQQAFLHVLELNNNTEQRIRQEFIDRLTSKDKLIVSLQERAECAESLLERTKIECQDNVQNVTEELSELQIVLSETQKSLSEERKTCEQNEKSLSDKQTIIENLMLRLPEQDKINKQINDLQNKIQVEENSNIMKDKKIDELQSEIRSKGLEVSELKLTIKNLNERQEYQKSLSEQQLKIEKQQLELQIKSEYQAKIDNYNAKMEKMQDRIDSLQEKIEDIQSQNKK